MLAAQDVMCRSPARYRAAVHLACATVCNRVVSCSPCPVLCHAVLCFAGAGIHGHDELRRTLRAWQGQALESMSQDLSCSMQPSPEALMQGYSQTALPQQQQSYGFSHTHRDSPPPLNLRPPTYLRNLASLASPLATPTWLQGGTFQTPIQRQTHARPAGATQRHDQSQSALPRNTMRVPADSAAALRYGPPDPRDSLTIPADTDAVPSNGPSVPNNTLAPGVGIPTSRGGDGDIGTEQQHDEEEDRLPMLSGSGMEEEVLQAELQALRAARQQFQRASLSQVHHLHWNIPVHAKSSEGVVLLHLVPYVLLLLFVPCCTGSL